MENTDTTDQAVETPEVDEKGPLAGFEEFSVEENETKDEVPEEVEAPDTSEETPEAKEEEAESEPVESEEEPEKSEEPDFSFKAPEEKATEEEAETWKNIGEDLDLNVQGEDFDDFKTAFSDKIRQAQEEAYKHGLDEAETELGDIDPETKNLLELSQNGVDLKEYLDPINTIDGYLKYDDKSLVEEEFKNIMNGEQRLYSDEQVASKIERLEDNEMLSDKADEIREGLIVEKQNLGQEIIAENQEQQERAYHQHQENLRAQSENFIHTVNSTNEFMGGKIDDGVKDHVTNMWNKGKVHELFNDPQKIVDYVLYHTVGDQVLKQRENDSFSNGQSKAKKSLHNIPPVTTAGASRGVDDASTEETGDFSVWESAMKSVRAE
tara:strand:+ start:167 stop:1306 length:1140 start_codon:yes stop_codon:yes gene_type:complete